jgi:epoxyqueuosine reductase QueG
VAAGLGTWGLNEMVLTRQFGPRVAFSTLMTDLPLEADPPLAEELCLGLHACGKCAAICPAEAIPKTAPPGAPLNSYRRLDKRACMSWSQPYGPDAFVEHIRRIVKAEGEERKATVESPTFHEIWQNMAIVKSGAFTGCIACVAACPVGEDYQRLGIQPSGGDARDGRS